MVVLKSLNTCSTVPKNRVEPLHERLSDPAMTRQTPATDTEQVHHPNTIYTLHFQTFTTKPFRHAW